MSASDPNSTIYMTDTPNQIKNKINKHGFSGGRDTEEEHRKFGGNPDVDVAFQYLKFFEHDDEVVAKIEADYRSGTLLTGGLKAMCIKILQDVVNNFQERRAKLTDADVNTFMDASRKINPFPRSKRNTP